jgi:molybdate transport system regulatory protein
VKPRIKVWVEHEGGLVLSDYRVRLLELVAETRSLAEAAERMGLSYRRAWGKLKEIEANLGTKLLASTAGGSGGGHTELTPAALDLVERYNRFRSRVSQFVDREFEESFEVEPAAHRA